MATESPQQRVLHSVNSVPDALSIHLSRLPTRLSLKCSAATIVSLLGADGEDQRWNADSWHIVHACAASRKPPLTQHEFFSGCCCSCNGMGGSAKECVQPLSFTTSREYHAPSQCDSTGDS